MQLGVKYLLSGMLIKHPNYEEKVVVESVVSEKSDYGIYWRHLNSHSTGGFLTGVPECGMIQIEDPSLREAYMSAEMLLRDIWGGARFDETQQRKTAAALLHEQIKTLTFSDLLTTVWSTPLMKQRLEGLYARQSLLLRSADGEEGGLVI